MEKVLSVVNKLPLSITTTLTIALAGGLGTAINSFGEFFWYVSKHFPHRGGR